jgi:hypothetical protein
VTAAVVAKITRGSPTTRLPKEAAGVASKDAEEHSGTTGPLAKRQGISSQQPNSRTRARRQRNRQQQRGLYRGHRRRAHGLMVDRHQGRSTEDQSTPESGVHSRNLGGSPTELANVAQVTTAVATVAMQIRMRKNVGKQTTLIHQADEVGGQLKSECKTLPTMGDKKKVRWQGTWTHSMNMNTL